MSKYRLSGEIKALSTLSEIACRIPAGAVVEYAPSDQQGGMFVNVRWHGNLCRVLLADMFDLGEFIGTE